MKTVLKYVVVVFRFHKGRFIQDQVREAKTEPAAIDLAERLAMRHAGAIAIEVYVYPETGEITAPRELAVFGNLPEDFLEEIAA